MVYARSFGKQTITLLVSGKLWRNSLIMQDEETGTLWSHVSGEGLDGPHKGRARKKLLEIIQYDAEFRKLVVAKGNLDPAMLDFLFGRPLTETLPNYGIKVRQEGKKTILTPTLQSKVRSR